MRRKPRGSRLSTFPLRQLYVAAATLSVCAAQSSPTIPSPTAPLPSAPDNAAPAASPADMYKQAMHPLDVVRGSLDNWSDAELSALAVGMHMASEDCRQTRLELYQGDDLYEFARLCAFGQDWVGASSAAFRYIATREEEHRAQSYAISISALVHMQAVDLAVQTAREMMRYPYDAETAYALRDLKNTLVAVSNPAVLPLARDEFPNLIAALAQGVPLKAAHGGAVMGVGALYESAMQLAFLERYAGNDEAARDAAAQVASSLPAGAVLAAEDRRDVDAATRRYQLLGARVPDVKVLRALQSPAAKMQIEMNSATATVLALFPDWCVECRNMMKTLTKFAALNRTTPIHAYGLVFADDSVVLGKAAHEQNFRQLAGTQTLIVPDTTPQTFGATGYPMGIVLDSTRTVRFAGTLPPDAFNGDGFISKTIVNMVKVAHQTRTLGAKGN